MEDSIKKYLELMLDVYESVEENREIEKEKAEEFNEICKNLFEELIENPGGIALIESKENIKTYRYALSMLSKLYSTDEIWDEIMSGGYSGLLFDELDVYISRVKTLSPTFLIIKPYPDDFNVYYNEAMKCWLHGLDNSAIILLSSLIENILKEHLENLNPDLILELIMTSKGAKRVEINFMKLIDRAEKEGIFSQVSRKNADNLRKNRNRIVHNGLNIDSKSALKIVTETKDIIEDIFN